MNIHISKIYTRTGDKGYTRLSNMKSVSKTNPLVKSYGLIENLNSYIGLNISLLNENNIDIDDDLINLLQNIQNDLFDIGNDLSFPIEDITIKDSIRINKDYIDRLEVAIDKYNESLEPLNSFILPGGNTISSYIHISRTLCREIEIKLIEQFNLCEFNKNILIYINRLSDLLFVICRVTNKDNEIKWIPLKNRKY